MKTWEDGKGVPEFVATRYELKQLAVHWWMEKIERDLWWVIYQQTGGSERWWKHYIDRRLNLIDEILGPEAMQKLFEDAAAKFRRLADLTDEDWRVLTEGTDEEQEAWRRRQEAKEAEEQAELEKHLPDCSTRPERPKQKRQ